MDLLNLTSLPLRTNPAKQKTKKQNPKTSKLRRLAIFLKSATTSKQINNNKKDKFIEKININNSLYNNNTDERKREN